MVLKCDLFMSKSVINLLTKRSLLLKVFQFSLPLYKLICCRKCCLIPENQLKTFLKCDFSLQWPEDKMKRADDQIQSRYNRKSFMSLYYSSWLLKASFDIQENKKWNVHVTRAIVLDFIFRGH